MLEDVSSIIACTLCKPKYVYLQYISTSAYISYQQSLFPSCWTKTESPFPPPPPPVSHSHTEQLSAVTLAYLIVTSECTPTQGIRNHHHCRNFTAKKQA